MSTEEESNAFGTVQLDEVRTVSIGGFRFKIGRKKYISRATGKRKQYKRVKAGRRSYRAHRAKIQMALRRWRRSAI